MACVELKLPYHRYEIRIGVGTLAQLGAQARALVPHEKAALFADPALAARFSPVAMDSLQNAGYQVVRHDVPAGEEHKNLDTIRALYDVMLNAQLERRSPVFALGGGVLGDSIGFVAATYLRGVPFVQVPTTLLAMVDSSVGGKVGVNVPQGKNLIGAFHQPHLVIIDVDTLATLPPRELRCGLAECVKHGVIRDPALFQWIEDHLDAILDLDRPTLVELVRQNVQIKAHVVMADEKETGERAHLNFGHTFGHAIEATQPYGDDAGYRHGEAIALGMVAATRLAIDLKRCEPALLPRLVQLFERIGLPTHSMRLAETDVLLRTMQMDKKVAAGKIRLVLPTRLGAVEVTKDASMDAIASAWASVRG